MEMLIASATPNLRTKVLLSAIYNCSFQQQSVPNLTKEFLLTMAYMGPFVLIGFGLCGYFVSGIAAKPIEQLVGHCSDLLPTPATNSIHQLALCKRVPSR
jgi:hypothetical protein